MYFSIGVATRWLDKAIDLYRCMTILLHTYELQTTHAYCPTVPVGSESGPWGLTGLQSQCQPGLGSICGWFTSKLTSLVSLSVFLWLWYRGHQFLAGYRSEAALTSDRAPLFLSTRGSPTKLLASSKPARERLYNGHNSLMQRNHVYIVTYILSPWPYSAVWMQVTGCHHTKGRTSHRLWMTEGKTRGTTLRFCSLRPHLEAHLRK